MFDFIVVGAGLSGSVIAERIANDLEKEVLIVEKRNHLGGNCADCYDKNGILIHKYGPHIFHTNIKLVWDYLSKFTEWNNYEHHVLGHIENKNVPLPFNLNTLHDLLPPKEAEYIEKKLINEFEFGSKVSILELRRNDDKDLKFVADFIYEKVFLNYTKKQWGIKPEELDPSVTERLPIIISNDNRYFHDKYQGIPKEGYHNLFKNLLSNNLIQISQKTSFNDVLKIKNNEIFFNAKPFKGKVIYTGMIDELFNYEYSTLKYRSLKFIFETHPIEYYQKVGTINYPNDYEFTRITEYKHLTLQKHDKTTISKEIPEEYEKNKNIPYYPIPKNENYEIYKKYLKKANKIENLFLLGRLADYKYYNMDMVIFNALKLFEKIKEF
ncbi:UDP-galactopyranose mutase [Methanobacterium formicicum]|uniref:UDP-galactopyranose mutase n=1 Tax=Methanobacterium formicicum (strain DSM 3637 / PP1) TaxID=1204725 RepID=K2RUF5_METFP|nr:UDP-galactopyranose mutase [Methanobacterium formicicum]EKF86365.1 UDP-galactopyranose mutase [Methanobacterium formicicum DSM 3637]